MLPEANREPCIEHHCSRFDGVWGGGVDLITSSILGLEGLSRSKYWFLEHLACFILVVISSPHVPVL